MKNKIPLVFVLGLVMVNLLSNSCKKDNNSNIPHLLTAGSWLLATVQVYNYVGDAQVGVIDSLYVGCDSTQTFTFNTNNTCTFVNFACLAQKTTGNWSLTANRLYLTTDMTCKDTTGNLNKAVKQIQPFSNAQIATLGVYSLVLQTGDVQPNYSATSRRRIVRYGFIKQKAVSQ
ncbi:hypothetical protein [Mucilaginibacter lappiensis]|uniref:Lipocalin-like domain-containing protein n=1 Tax=Mucilaginibacter lappiensis TaxID=354630 RepID=A0A841JSE1_9SPHI|nr:hypothetical protein [Mucilaginibacter lappiensis]MBB6131698.1 hypothetical protein [Mucilaginibacter lappiensis]